MPEQGRSADSCVRVAVFWSGEADVDVLGVLSGSEFTLLAQARDADEVDGWPASLDAAVICVQRLGAGQFSDLRKLRAELPAEAALVVVADTVTRRSLHEAERAGVDALVPRDRVDSALRAAVRAACSGLFVVPRDLVGRIARPALTVRERQVLAMVVLGCANSEIARRLYLAETTVKSHLSTAFAKLGVRSRSEAVATILDPSGGLGTGILTIADGERAPSRRTKIDHENGLASTASTGAR